jgi:hypothetical protein
VALEPTQADIVKASFLSTSTAATTTDPRQTRPIQQLTRLTPKETHVVIVNSHRHHALSQLLGLRLLSLLLLY